MSRIYLENGVKFWREGNKMKDKMENNKKSGSSIRIYRSSRRHTTPKLVLVHSTKKQGSDHYSLQYKQKPHSGPTNTEPPNLPL